MVYHPPEKQFDLERIMNQDIDPPIVRCRKKEKKKILSFAFRKAAVTVGVVILVLVTKLARFLTKLPGSGTLL